MSISATQNTNHLVFAKDHVLAMLSDATTFVSKRIQQHRAFSQTMTQLGALSERELNDIGITRSDIRRLALEASQEI